MTVTFNFSNGEIVSSPMVILSGWVSIGRGIVEFINNDNKVFPPSYWEVNNNYFKAIIHVSPHELNVFKVRVMDNGYIDHNGFANYQGQPPRVMDTGELVLQYFPLPQNKPIHLCIIVGKDSKGQYDMPQYKLKRGEVANLDSAIRKLKVAGRMMQAYTQDEMRLSGFSNRTFQFAEETVHQQGIFGYNVNSATPHQEVKIHVLRSPKTVAELRDPNLAQQNPKGTDTGGLFSHALDLIRHSPELYFQREQSGTCIQCAVIYLDATYDVAKDLILTHAALGGGNGDIKLAIFGSHGLHSWPINFPMINPCFLDATPLSKREVANDANQCGTSWECLNITMGAFQHEIGHSLGSPHQVDGVMLRDYIWWNRSFMTRENECIRTKTRNAIIGHNGSWSTNQLCHWNVLDKIRYLHHGSFSIAPDETDPYFSGHVFTTTFKNDNSYGDKAKAPTSYSTPDNGSCLVKSDAGIFLIELITKDLARCHFAYLPRKYGGQGLQYEILLDYNNLFNYLRSSTNEVDEKFQVRILSLGGDLFINNFKQHCVNDPKNIITSDFGIGKGKINGFKSALLGRTQGNAEKVIGFDIYNITKVRVYHGGALDGLRFYFNNSSKSGKPPIPPRNYLDKLSKKLARTSITNNAIVQSVLLGNEKDHYTDVPVSLQNPIKKFHFRNGAWIDAIQLEFSNGERSNMFGNANGGHLSTLESPAQGFTIVGMYGYTSRWLDGLGIIYTSDL